MHRIGIGQHTCHHRMAHFMVGCNGPFAFADDTTLTCRACNYAINGLFKLAHPNFTFVTPGCEDSGLVEQVRKGSAGETGCLVRQRFQRNVCLQWLALGMYLVGVGAAANIWSIKYHLAIQPAWTALP